MICRVQPFKETSKNWLSLFNELMISVYLYLAVALTDINPDGDIRQ